MRRKLGAGIAIALGISACRGAEGPLVPRSVPRLAASRSLIADTSAWNTYGFEISTLVRKVGPDGKPHDLVGEPITYSVERTLTGGRWVTTLMMAPMPHRGSATAAEQFSRGVVARLVDDGTGAPPRLYDAQGNLIKVPKVPRLDLVQNVPTFPAAPPAAHPSPAARSAVQSFILTPDDADTRHSAFRRMYGRATTDAATGHDIYSARRVGGSVETVVVDDALGAPLELIAQEGGATTLHATFEYQRQPDGAAVLSHSVIESTGKRGTFITERTFQNVYLGLRQ